jgi:NAD(P)-dependent dehydrogenase (short-subunit alcohol dehydrogenase family)
VLSLEGRVAVVTGAGSGIGAATAALLAQEGALVAVVDRDAARAREVADRIGGSAVAVPADVARESDVAAMVEQIVAWYGRIDLLHNHAGLLHPQDGSILDIGEEAIDATLATNVKGQMLVAKHVARRMVRAGAGGAIVNTASDLAFIALAGVCAYVTSKAAVVGLTKAMAADLAPHRIRVNAVCPGFVHTGMTAGLAANEAVMDDMRQSYLIPDLGQPEDVASAVVFLLSNQARFVTGTTLLVDGGHTVR